MTEVLYRPDHMILSVGYRQPSFHRHLAKHILVSLQSKLECRVAGQVLQCKGICIDSEVFHTAAPLSGTLLVLLVDETSSLSDQLEDIYLRGQSFCILDEESCSRVTEAWEKRCDDWKQVDADLLSCFGFHLGQVSAYDVRIRTVVDYLHRSETVDGNTLDILCKSICLSKSRLAHLFKQQIGVSLGSYMVFEKVRKTYGYVQSGEDLTTACIHAGFYSSSHFSATYRRMFGLSCRDFHHGTIIHDIS